MAASLLSSSAGAANAIWDEELGSPLPFTWNHTNFDGFNVSGIGTENLTIVQTNLGAASGKTRTIRNWEDPSGAGLIYNTTRYLVEYEVSKNKGLSVERALNKDGYSVYNGNYYARVNLFGEPYIAINGKANKLTKLVLEQKENEQKVLTIGETWNMGGGWTLTANGIDAKAIPRQAWLTLSRDGVKMHDKVISQGQVYTYVEKSIAGESDVPVFVTYAESVFAGETTDFVVLKYTWLVSRNVTEFKAGDNLGLLRVVSSSDKEIKFDNNYTISLTSNYTINLSRNLKFRVLDNISYLKFYPTLEPKLNITASSTTIPVRISTDVTFTVTYNGTPVSEANIVLSCAGLGSGITGADGKVNISINPNYVGIIIVDAGKSGYTNGTTTIQTYSLPIPARYALASWNLSENYVLNLIAIDARSSLRQAWLQLSRDGIVVKDSVVTKGSVFSYCPLNCTFNTTVDTIFSGEQGIIVKLINASQYSETGVPLMSNMTYLFKSGNFTGIDWNLNESYVLRMMGMDTKAYPRQVWLELLKNNTIVDDAFISPGERYYYNSSGRIILTAKVDVIFSSATLDIVKLTEVSQYSEIDGNLLINNSTYTFPPIIDRIGWMNQPLYENYTIDVLGIDAKSTPRMAWLRLFKNDAKNDTKVDEKIAVHGDVWHYSISNKSILYAEVSGIFSGSTADVVQLRNVTQYSELDGSVLIDGATYTIPNISIPIPAPTPTPDIYGYYEVGGKSASENATAGEFDLSALPVTWTPQSFAGFYYDLNENTGKEELSIKDINISEKTIPKRALYYNTTAQPKMLNVVKYAFGGNTSLAKAYGLRGFEDGNYYTAGWQGEKYTALNGKVNRLSRLILEQGATRFEKKTLAVGDTWDIGGGWTLTLQEVAYRQAWLVFGKDGVKKEDIFISAGNIYTYVEKNFANETDVPLFLTYVDTVFAGATTDMVQLRYTWAVSTDVKTFQSRDKFGVFEVADVNAAEKSLKLSNINTTVNLSQAEVHLTDNLKFRVADNSTLRFMPAALLRHQGLYELRGAVWNQTPINGFGGTGTNATWNSSNFAGFFYDFSLGKEELKVLQTDLSAYQRTIGTNKLVYTSSAQPKMLNVVKYAFGGNASDASASGLERFENGSYYLAGWQGEKYVALHGRIDKLTKLVFEQPPEETKTLAVGDTWELGDGWTLTPQAVDAKASPRQVWLVLSKDGVKKDDKVLQEKKIYTYVEKSLAGENDVPLFVTYVDSIFAGAASDMAQLRYTWVISTNVTTIQIGDKFGLFTVVDLDIAYKHLELKNRDTAISLIQDSTIDLMGNLKFRVADSAVLRFMPVVVRFAEVPSPAPSPTPTPEPSVPVSSPDSRYVWDANLGANLTYTWTPTNFDGFYYDLDNNAGSESLTMRLDSNASRSIQANNLTYAAAVENISFKYKPWGSYNVIGFIGEKYFAGYTANSTPSGKKAKSTIGSGQLHKVLLDDDDKRTVSEGGALTLKEGYVLKVTAIDVGAGPGQVWITLLKDESEMDSDVVAGGEDYVYSKKVGSVSDLPIIAVHFDSVFRGREVNAVFITGIFQISENYTSVKSGYRYGVMEVTSASSSGMEMKNPYSVYLGKGSEIDIMGYLKFKVADSDILRFYPINFYYFYYYYGYYSNDYERRGAISTGSNNAWDALNFAGFWYDLDSGVFSEYLLINNLSGRTIPEGYLNYTTQRIKVPYNVAKITGKNPNGTNGTYIALGWIGDKHAAIKGKSNKLAKVVVEQGTSISEKKTLTVGETWDMGEGYTLTAQSIDAKATPRQAWLVFSKDGVKLDDKVILQGQVYTYTASSFAGEIDVPIFVTYIDGIFAGATSDMALLRYTWLISSDVNEIRTGEKYGVFNVTKASSDSITLENNNSIELGAGSSINLVGALNFTVADASNLRFYPSRVFAAPTNISFYILSYYRSLGGNPNVVETTDLLKAADDWSRDIAPPGFSDPITTVQLLALADEWSRS